MPYTGHCHYVNYVSDVGGRVRSDIVDGFVLDRGFHVFLESYPQSIDSFNYPDLKLKSFLPGALVRLDRGFYRVSDPLRRPQDLLASLISPIGSITDKIKVKDYS
jgi:Flavin containing amine oxidoreductase